MEYGYVYQETQADSTAAEAYAVCEGNVRASLLWDRWRAENAPTAGAIAARASAETLRWLNKRGATQDLVASNGSHEPPAAPARWGSD